MLKFDHFWKCTPEMYLQGHVQISKYAIVVNTYLTVSLSTELMTLHYWSCAIEKKLEMYENNSTKEADWLKAAWDDTGIYL